MGWSHDLQSLSNTFLRLSLVACGQARSPDQGNKTPGPRLVREVHWGHEITPQRFPQRF